MSESGGVEYYIDRASLVMVEGLTRKNMTYTVVASDEKGNSIKIYVAADRQHGHEKSLVFDADRRGLTETIQVKISYGRSLIPIKFSRSHSSRWIYVGSDRAP
jgi:hypothetical protein